MSTMTSRITAPIGPTKWCSSMIAFGYQAGGIDE